MKILVLADAESKYLWDYFDKKKLEGIDLIISCGDLAPQYLSFLATFTHAPVLYVYGNHDTCYADTPRMAVSALTIESMYIKEYGSWALEAVWSISTMVHRISIPRKQWRSAFVSWVGR